MHQKVTNSVPRGHNYELQKNWIDHDFHLGLSHMGWAKVACLHHFMS